MILISRLEALVRSVFVFHFLNQIPLDFLFLFCEHHPVVLVVVLVTVASEEFLEHGPHGRVIGSLVESKVPGLAQILGELHWVAFAKDFN